jgi:hypothetical protein
MAHLQYFTYPGKGEEQLQKYHYSQAVRVGDRYAYRWDMPIRLSETSTNTLTMQI